MKVHEKDNQCLEEGQCHEGGGRPRAKTCQQGSIFHRRSREKVHPNFIMNTPTSPAMSFSEDHQTGEVCAAHKLFTLSSYRQNEKAQTLLAGPYVSYPCMGQARLTGPLLHRGPGAWCSEHSCEEQNQNWS